MSEKTTRKEMKAPDAFQRASLAWWSRLLAHKQALLIGLGALVVLLIAAGVIDAVRANSRNAAGASLADALDVARQGVEGHYDPSTDPEKPTFPSLKEKREAFAAKLEAVIADHPGTDAASSATLFLAETRFDLDDLSGAQKGFTAFLDESDVGNPLRFLAHEGLGYVYEAQKDWDKALDAFRQIEQEGAGEHGQALSGYHQGRILELSGKKTEAATEFQRVKDEFSKAPATRFAEDRLTALAAQGIVPAPKAAETKP